MHGRKQKRSYMDSTKTKKPWTVLGVPWKTESAFWGWVRGVLRKGWSKHPVKLEYIKQHRKRIKNPNPKGKVPEVWGMTCQCCGQDKIQSDIQIDHRGDSQSFTGLEHAESYMSHLFLVDFESLRELCSDCHKIVNHCQLTGLTFAEAKKDKVIIDLLKPANKSKMEVLLKEHNYVCKNPAQRRAALTEIFDKENV